VAQALAKTFLWSWGRRSEVVGLQWEQIRIVGKEIHFATIGKWGVEKWFRIPNDLHVELEKLRIESPFIFAAYNDQLRQFHSQGSHPHCDRLIATQFSPENLGDWFYRRMVEWSESLPRGRAYTHIFRKTSLQYARNGEDVNREVAKDARLSEAVMMNNYVRETDEVLRRASNRTYHRILSSLEPSVASRYGHPVPQKTREQLEADHAIATEKRDWAEAARIATELSQGWG
jgi:integrase